MSVADEQTSSSKTAFDHDTKGGVAERAATTGGERFGNAGRPPQKQPEENTRGAASPAQASGVTLVDHAQRDSTGGATIACAAVGRSNTPKGDAEGSIDPSVIEGDFDDDAATSTTLRVASVAYGWSVPLALAIEERAQCLLGADQALRHRLGHPAPGPTTLTVYRRRLKNLDARLHGGLDTGAPKILQLLAPSAKSAQTFKVDRSALKWRYITLVRGLLARCNLLRSDKAQQNAWLLECLKLRDCVEDLKELEYVSRADALEYSGAVGRTAGSKKYDLAGLPRNWRSRFLAVNEDSPTYREAGVLLCVAGLRPFELNSGVRIRLDASRRFMMVRIHGAKVRENAGQPWRTFRVESSKLPAWFLHRLIGQGTYIVRVAASSLRSHLGRLSPEVFDSVKVDKRPHLSAYLFRHALVTDLRESGWESEEIAGVIGELAAETIRWYGIRRRGGTRPKATVAIVRGSVKTARVVRPVELSGLHSLMRTNRVKLGKH